MDRMKKQFIPSSIFIALFVMSASASADFNAKTPDPYEKFYGELGYIASFHEWGHAWVDNGGGEWDGQQEMGWASGLRTSIYAVLNEKLDIGGYISYQRGHTWYEYGVWDDRNHHLKVWALGFAMKLGYPVSHRVDLGFGLDAGMEFARWRYHRWDRDDSDLMVGIQAHPQFIVDVMIFNAGKFKLGAYASGGFIFRIHGGDHYDDVHVNSLLFGPTTMIGVAVGI